MKKTHPQQEVYDFTKADSALDFALEHGMTVHGHTLIWHSSIPEWLENLQCDSAEFEQIIKNYITTVVTHFKGRVVSWDVVNEGLNDTTGDLRNTLFLRKMGKNYIHRCFQYAAEADPDALLFYNDYGQEWSIRKHQGMMRLLKSMQKEGIKIDGVGFQVHTQIGNPPIANFQKMTNDVVALGLKVHFSELDISVNGQVDTDGPATTFEDDVALAQKERYRQIVSIMKGVPAEQQWGVTTWGVSDKDSWLRRFFIEGKKEWPLLFNDEYQKKPAYDGFAEGLK